jgi:3-oxoacyl-[acyl-carrier protein] reductase
VNAIAPGWIDTPGTAFSIADRDATAREVDRRIPMNRLGTPDEIAPAALYLASDVLASYVTGSTIGVDGGWLLQ